MPETLTSLEPDPKAAKVTERPQADEAAQPSPVPPHGMNPLDVLRQFDRDMRADPAPEAGVRIECAGALVRAVSPGECCVIHADFLGHHRRATSPPMTGAADPPDLAAAVDEAIAAELAHARSSGVSLEWKVFGHDWPSDLAARLEAAGFEADEPETLMVLALSRHDDGGDADDGSDAAVAAAAPDICTIHRVTDGDRLEDYATATRAAFGDADPERLATFRARLTDPALALFVAYADAQPVAAARLELPPARAFASLWGGGVAPTHRSRGLYRALVHHRATAARARRYRYLTVDARATSRPILTRLGFVPLTTIRGWLAPRG